MKTILMMILVVVLSAGCSGEHPTTVDDNQRAKVTSDEVVMIAQGTDDLGDESLWIVSSIGAQVLESKYERYKAAGLSETDFARMPDNRLTRDINRLYLDMKPLLQ